MNIPDEVYTDMVDNGIKEHAERLYTFSRLRLGVMLGEAYTAGYIQGKKDALDQKVEQPK